MSAPNHIACIEYDPEIGNQESIPAACCWRIPIGTISCWILAAVLWAFVLVVCPALAIWSHVESNNGFRTSAFAAFGVLSWTVVCILGGCHMCDIVDKFRQRPKPSAESAVV
jgi:hypothetical protein